MDKDLEQALKRLKDCSQSIANQMDGVCSQIQDVFENKITLPDGCPSKQSMAAMIFREIDQSLDEVNAAYKNVHQYF